PGWEYQFTAAIGHLRTAWAALADVARTTPATRTEQTIAQVKNVLRRLRAGKGAPLFVFDAGYSAAALADGLSGCPAHVLVRLGTLVHGTVERLPDGRDPHRAMWLWHSGPGPLSLDELWRAYLARFDIEHAFKLLKGTFGLTAAKVRTPEQADRWVRLLMAA